MTPGQQQASPLCLSVRCLSPREGACVGSAGKRPPFALCADQVADNEELSDFFQTSRALEKGNRLVPGHSQTVPSPLSLFGQRRVCKRDAPSSSLYRGCGLRGEMDTSGVRRGNTFWSLHLTNDMVDINLAGWHQEEK